MLPRVTEALIQLRTQARAFGETNIAPSADARDEQRKWDPSLMSKLFAAGYGTIGLPDSERSCLEACVTVSGLSEGARDAGFIRAWLTHQLAQLVIASAGSEAQRQTHLPALKKGACIAATTCANIDNLHDQLEVTRSGNARVLNGQCTDVINAPFANVFVVAAHVRDGAPTASTELFLIEKGTAGVTIDSPTQTAHLRTSPVATVRFNQVSVTDAQIIGTAGHAAKHVGIRSSLSRLWLLHASAWVGVSEQLLAHAVTSSQQQTRFGRALRDYQTVRLNLFDVMTRTEISKRLISYAAALHVPPPPEDAAQHDTNVLIQAAIARAYVTRTTRLNIDTVIDTMAPTLKSSSELALRMQRDSLLVSHDGGSDLTLQGFIAGHMMGIG